jgi:RNA polymerase sigma factor (sigma-70 family)
MADGRLGPVLEHVRHLLGASSAAQLTDGQLLQDFIGHPPSPSVPAGQARQAREAAFAALLQRHGPMVHGVCRRLLQAPQDVEDAFQATFLVLIRKAGSIAKKGSVGSWLYGVAYRTAVRVRAQERKRQRHARALADAPQQAPASGELRELQRLLDQELHGLPEKYRAPLVLHYLAGKTKGETARQLGWTEGTVSGRLARGRQLLRGRLARRGLNLSAGVLALGLARGGASAAVPLKLLSVTLRAALRYGTKGTVAGILSERVVELAAGVARGFWLTQVKIGAGLLVMLSALAAGAALAVRPVPPAQPPAARQDAPPPALTQARPLGGKDLLGDPLPPGVLVRLGTNRGRHGQNLSALEFARDGQRLATRAGDGTVRLWDAVSGKELHVFRGEPGTPGARLWCFAFVPDGCTLATGGGDGMVRFWDLATGRQLRRVRGNPVGVRSLAFASDGKLLAVAGEDNQLSLWDPAAWKEVRSLCPANPDPRPEASHLPVKAVTFSPDDKTLAVFRLPLGGWPNAYAQSSLELWDVGTGRQRGRFTMDSFSPTPTFTPDGKTLVRREAGGRVSLRAVDTGREVRSFQDTESGSRTLALDAGGRTLAVASTNSIRLWDLVTGKRGQTLEDSANLAQLAFTRDGRTLAGGWDDGTFQLWNVATGRKLLKPFPGHRGWVGCVAYSPDGRTLATGSATDGTLRLWQASTGQEIRHWETRGPLALAFSPDGKTLASSGGDRVVRCWDVATGKETLHFRAGQEPGNHPHSVRFSPDGKLLAAADHGGIRLWRVTGQEVRRLQMPAPSPRPGAVTPWSLAFSTDGQFLAASRGKVVCLWETTAGREVGRFVSPGADVTALAFSADGRTLASAGDEDTVRLWEVATGKERRLRGPGDLPDRLDANGVRVSRPSAGVFTALAFSADSETLLGGRLRDEALYVWDLTRDRPAAKVPGHKENVSGLAVARDGKTVASASADRTVLVWDVARLKRLAHEGAAPK